MPKWFTSLACPNNTWKNDREPAIYAVARDHSYRRSPRPGGAMTVWLREKLERPRRGKEYKQSTSNCGVFFSVTMVNALVDEQTELAKKPLE